MRRAFSKAYPSKRGAEGSALPLTENRRCQLAEIFVKVFFYEKILKKLLTNKKKAANKISVALVAKLVDAHASGACCLRQWKFESSPEHH